MSKGQVVAYLKNGNVHDVTNATWKKSPKNLTEQAQTIVDRMFIEYAIRTVKNLPTVNRGRYCGRAGIQS